MTHLDSIGNSLEVNTRHDTSAFANPQSPLPDGQPENYSLLLDAHRRAGQKDKAIALLLAQSRSCRLRVAEEIVLTYLYLGDANGALDYLKHYQFTNKHTSYLQALIKLVGFIGSISDDIKGDIGNKKVDINSTVSSINIQGTNSTVSSINISRK